MPPPISTTPAVPRPTGAAAKKIEEQLRTLSYAPGKADAQWTKASSIALSHFQKDAGLKATGTADAATLAALQKKSNARLDTLKNERTRLFTAGARVEARRLDRLAVDVDRFTADGKLTAQERKSLREQVKVAEAKANPMVAEQSNAARDALEVVEALLKNGKLTRKSADAVKALTQGRRNLLAEAFEDARSQAVKGSGWSSPFHGIKTKKLGSVQVVAIDLADPRVSMQTNSESARGKSVKAFAENARAEVAINGDFFSFGSFKPSGLAITDGKQWSNTQPGFEGFLSFNGRHAELERPFGKPGEWSRNAVSARPTVLVDGKISISDPAKNEHTSRTGVGLSKDGRTLFLIAGRNLSGTDVGNLLRKVGADDGLAMDGGGSAQMFIKGRGMVQKSTDPGGARAVANAILIQSR